MFLMYAGHLESVCVMLCPHVKLLKSYFVD